MREVFGEREWPDRHRSFANDFGEFLEREVLMLADPDKYIYIRDDEPFDKQQHYFICMKCDVAIPWDSIYDGCPSCQSDKWIGAATRPKESA
jgi:hypothetical protein